MDGAQACHRYLRHLTAVRCDREASCMGRIKAVKSCGPCRNENPAGSTNSVRCESLPPQEQGFPSNDDRLGVSRP